MQLNFKFLHAIQARSRRIPKAEWAKHKDDIVREYRSNDLNYTVDWMARNRNFHASAKQLEHQLKRWDIRKYHKSNHAIADARKLFLHAAAPDGDRWQESLQSATSLAPADTSSNDVARDRSGGTSSTTMTTISTKESETGYESKTFSATLSVTLGPTQNSTNDARSAGKGTSPAGSVRSFTIATPEPYLSRSLQPRSSATDITSGDPTFDSGPLSPGTSSFLKLAQRISRMKRGKPSMESLPPQTKRLKRSSWDRQWPDGFSSVDSLSDAVSSLHLGSGWQSRRASVEKRVEIRMGDSRARSISMDSERPSHRRGFSDLSCDSERSSHIGRTSGLGSIAELDVSLERNYTLDPADVYS